MPLLLLLHGGGGGARRSQGLSAVMDRLMDSGDVNPMVVIALSCRRSLYVNRRDGTAVMGASMGGQGVLRLAFKHPVLFGATAASAPGIETGLTWKDVQLSA